MTVREHIYTNWVALIHPLQNQHRPFLLIALSLGGFWVKFKQLMSLMR